MTSREAHDASALPRGRPSGATPASTATSARCAGPGWRRSPGSTRRAAGACAGPLVAAAAILPEGKAGLVPGLADSKLLTAKARERCYEQVLRRALAWSVVVIEPGECDRLGMHVANVEALRRSLARLELRPAYVLTDGFPVDGLEVPGLAMWKGDRVAACISAASVIAKVTRDRIMCELHEQFPAYDFAMHKGYMHRRARGGARPSTARARCTGCGSSTYGVPLGIIDAGTPQSGAPAGAVGPRPTPPSTRNEPQEVLR